MLLFSYIILYYCFDHSWFCYNNNNNSTDQLIFGEDEGCNVPIMNPKLFDLQLVSQFNKLTESSMDDSAFLRSMYRVSYFTKCIDQNDQLSIAYIDIHVVHYPLSYPAINYVALSVVGEDNN